MNNQKKISTILSNGTKVEYTVILTFKSNINNKNYVIYTDNTYDQNKKLVEFYFDMVAGSGIENGVPYILDIYLDLVITGKNSKYVLDEDELQEGLEQNIISQVEYDEAYNTLDMLMKKYETNEELDKLKNVMQNYFDEMYNSLN